LSRLPDYHAAVSAAAADKKTVIFDQYTRKLPAGNKTADKPAQQCCGKLPS